MSKIDCNNFVNQNLKKEYEWLKEVDKFALTNSVYNMDSAYQKFFKEHAGYLNLKVRSIVGNRIKLIVQIVIFTLILKIIKSNFQNSNG